jgi:hypothetical protein
MFLSISVMIVGFIFASFPQNMNFQFSYALEGLMLYFVYAFFVIFGEISVSVKK